MENVTYKLTDLDGPLDAFEGPLDVLLGLIEKNKYNILDIPIAAICDQYLAYLSQMQSLDMEITTDFLGMASQLMVWKSTMLLPHEEEGEKPPRFELSDLLLRHQHMKEAAGKMHPLYAYFSNRMAKDTDEIAPDKTFVDEQDPAALCAAVRRVNAYRDAMERAQTNFTPMVSKPIVPVEGKIVMILQMLDTLGTATLREILTDAPSLSDMIATFMGVLELMKVRRILMEEDEDEENAVRGEDTRFFLNPDAPADQQEAAKGEAAAPV